ncbi:hypothetical protein PT974_12503 [Cladobotryum mycophilum]|uniref:Serine hydrolase domain-containing protein n=1 Tax=Cladobotryum mycophilum TaxID=491253 RepID=A0ABR0S948_9HYPO
MRVLCLHGRGSNNEIFQMQTAAIRAELDDFEWEFVQGTVRHTEGNWSLYTTSFSNLPLYTYYNPLLPASILQTEDELRHIIETEGPFDGVLGYSGGGGLAAQLIIKDCLANPFALPHERPFRFAIFINAASPLNCFDMETVDGTVSEDTGVTAAIMKEASSMFLRPSAVRKKAGVDEADQPDLESLQNALQRLRGVVLPDGTPAFTDGVHGLTRFNEGCDDILIDIPTLHIRCKQEEDRHHGKHLYEMSEPSTAKEFHHGYGHDFPRGRIEIKKIAQLIRDTAELA